MVAALGVALASYVAGAIAVVEGIFALGEPDEGSALARLVAAAVTAAAAVCAIVAAIRRRGWSRPLLVVVAAAFAGITLLQHGQSWFVAAPIVVGALLLWLPPSRRWFSARRTGRAADPASPAPSLRG